MEREKVLVSAEETARQKEYMDKVRALHERRTTKPLAYVHTYGCQQNVADSQHIMGMLEAMGCDFVTDPEDADIVVLNTCAIRENAEKTVYGMLGQLTHTKAANPDQIICLCGCMAQQPRVAEKVKTSYRHVDLVLGPQAEWRFPELLYRAYTERGRVGEHYVRLQQLLLVLHRALRPRPRTQPRAGADRARGPRAGRGGL